MDYGIYRYSNLFSYALNDVARQLIYDHYNDKLGDALKKCIEDLNSDIIGCNDDYRGFSTTGQFEVDEEIEELLKCFNSDENFTLKAIEHYQMHLALKSFGIKNVNIEQTLAIGKQVEMEIPEKEPMPMLSVNLLIDYLRDEKSEFEIAQLLAYMAIRSILGKKPYGRTNVKLVAARMFGYSSHKAIPAELNPAIKALMIKYTKRYQMGKLLLQLKLSWHVVTYSRNMRGLYVGIGISLVTLAMAGEKRKQKFKIEQLKKAEIEAQQKAQNFLNQHLNKGGQLNKDSN